MKSLNDKEIQKILENEEAFPETEQSADYKIYSRLFEALNTEPDFELSADFSDQMVSMVSRQMVWKRDLRYYLLLSLITVLAVAVGIGAIAFVNMSVVIKLFSFLQAEKWIILFVLVLFIFIQISDKQLKKYLLHHS